MISEGTQIDTETCVALIPTGKCVCHLSLWSSNLQMAPPFFNSSCPYIDGGKKYIYMYNHMTIF